MGSGLSWDEATNQSSWFRTILVLAWEVSFPGNPSAGARRVGSINRRFQLSLLAGRVTPVAQRKSLEESQSSEAVVGRMMPLLARCPHPHPQNLWLLYLRWHKGLRRCDWIKDLELKRLCWIIQVGPVKPPGCLEVEEGGRRVRGVVMTEVRSEWCLCWLCR